MMRRFILALVGLFVLSIDPARAAFGIFQTYSIPTVPQIACNLVTGVASVGGPCTSTTTCNGSGDDAPAFKAFNTWGRANQGSSQIVLTIPNGSNCVFNSGQTYGGSNVVNTITAGLKNVIVEGTGATLSQGSQGFRLGGGGGVCYIGIASASGCSARLQTISPGATTVTLTASSFSAGYASRFAVGNWVMIGGLDTQSGFQSAFGDPPNNTFFEWRQITSICNNTAGCIGSAIITLDRALTNFYSSDWPNYNPGDNFHSDGGGPATIYKMNDNWAGSFEYRGLTLNQTGQTYGEGQYVTVRSVIIGGINGFIPTQNETWSAYNSDFTNVSMETDKLVGTMLLDGVTISKIVNQSTSTNSLIIRNSTFSIGIDGGAKTTDISDTALGQWAPGIYAYGSLGITNPTTCTRCTITSLSLTLGPSDASGFWSKSGGIITMPNAAAQGSGPGQRYFVPGSPGSLVYYFASNTNPPITFACCETIGSFQVGAITSDPWPATDNQTLTTTINTTNGSKNLNVPSGPFVSGDVGKTIIVNGAGGSGGQLKTWITGFSSATDVTLFNAAGTTVSSSQTIQWGTSNTYIATNQSGGFPNISAISTGNIGLKTVSAPNITCDVCNAGNLSSDGYAISVQAGATPSAPLGSYVSKQYTPTSAQGNLAVVPGRGIFKSLSINVTAAATAAGSVTLQPGGQFHWYMVSQNTPGAPAPVDWLPANFFINLKQAGDRVITPSGVTCNGSPGACSGDTITPPANMATMWMQNGAMTPYMPSTFTGAPTFTVTLQTDPIQ
jgi:hypothetical protein